MHLQLSLDPGELLRLEERFGPAPHEHYCMTVHHPFLSEGHQRLVKDGRRGEICYIMHRGRPADGLLFHTKTIYPESVFRLPTGGIQQGEGVLETLEREIYEETGLVVGTSDGHVRLQRYLGVITYALEHVELQQIFHYATYHFLVEMPPNAQLDPQDEEELLGGWLWTPASQMAQMAERLENVHLIAPDWGDWGRYRAISHRFVAKDCASLLIPDCG
jgi:8-oxo-dGTP pyrophosphatase MutT (NUDIX family)